MHKIIYIKISYNTALQKTQFNSDSDLVVLKKKSIIS